MKTFYYLLIVFFIFINVETFAQTRKEYRKDANLRLNVNTFYNDLYILNSSLSYVTGPYCEQGSGTNYLLTGYIAPHYYVFPKNWRIGFVISMPVLVRIRNEESSPVRTPSYYPGGTFYFQFTRDTIKYKYLSLSIVHHSNGQDGSPLNIDGTINTKTGNFGTNYAELALNWGKQDLTKNRYYKLGFELHSGYFGYGDEPAYRDKYGKMRVNFYYSGSKFINLIIGKVKKKKIPQTVNVNKQELWRSVLETMVIVDPVLDVTWQQRFNAEFKIYRKIKNSPNTSWFFSFGYVGHDLYNIYFLDNYPVVKFGIAAGNFLFKSYTK